MNYQSEARLVSRPTGHLHPLHEVSQNLSMHTELGLEMLEDGFHPDSVSSSRCSFEWRVSLSSGGATHLNYNLNLLKHWVFWKGPLSLSSSFYNEERWITKAENFIYFKCSFWVDSWVGSPYVMTHDRKFFISNTMFHWSALPTFPHSQIMLCNFPRSRTSFKRTSMSISLIKLLLLYAHCFEYVNNLLDWYKKIRGTKDLKRQKFCTFLYLNPISIQHTSPVKTF